MISENDIIIEQTDVQILNGDFDVQDANNQNIKHLLIGKPGDYKIFPSVGVGIYYMQNADLNNFSVTLSKIREQIIKDGYKNPDISGRQTGDVKSELEITAIRKGYPDKTIL